MLLKLTSVDGHPHLESILLLVRDTGTMNQGHIANWDARDQVGRGIAAHITSGLLDRLRLRADFISDRVALAFTHVEGIASGYELLPVGVDPVPGYILSQGYPRRARQIEILDPTDPARNFRKSNHSSRLESITRQEALRRQDAVGKDIVDSFGLLPFTQVERLHPPNEPVAASVE